MSAARTAERAAGARSQRGSDPLPDHAQAPAVRTRAVGPSQQRIPGRRRRVTRRWRIWSCTEQDGRWMIEEAGDRDPSGARLGAMLQVMLARYPSERLPEIKMLVAAGAGAAAGEGRGGDADAGSVDDSPAARSHPAAAAARRGGSGVLALGLFLTLTSRISSHRSLSNRRHCADSRDFVDRTVRRSTSN